MNVLITGCVGFIGSHVCEALLRDGNQVWGLDNLTAAASFAPDQKADNVALLQQYENFHFVSGDVRDTAVLQSIWQECGPDRVVHLAHCTGVRASIENPVLFCDVNLTGTAQVLEKARLAKTPVVIGSSAAVYGRGARVPHREDDAAAQPASPYGATLRAAELLASTYHYLYDFPLVCLRFFTVYGPRQRTNGAFGEFSRAVLHDEQAALHGDGTTARDFCYVDDAVRAIVTALERAPQFGFEIINVGGGRVVELRRLLEVLEKAAGRRAKIEWRPDQRGGVRVTCADLSLARALLNFEPQVSLEDGARRTIEWMRESR
ncbi:MAG TPA: GDP-mannose 4,6-dehydratase [Abditibacteriaceae bacterium]|jgi:UDP-glucuronate 4-epimerase